MRAQTTPSEDPHANPAPARDAALEERLRQLEETNRKLLDRYEASERRHAQEIKGLTEKYEALQRKVADDSKGTRAGGSSSGDPTADSAAPATNGTSDRPAGDASSVEDLGGPRGQPALPESSPRAKGAKRLPLKANFGPGFELMTEDEEYQLQFHYLSQVDFRLYEQSNQDPVHSGFSFPRQRLYFNGRLTKPIEYYITLNRGFGTLDVFDAFINYRWDQRLQLKVGRYKTPFSYEFYAVAAPDFLVPERSLFASNFTPNRQMGMMGWGQVFDERLDYAVGIFNGNRLSFQDSNEGKDIISYLNFRPFLNADSEWAFLKNLNVGGSVDFGSERNTILPNVLRTSIAASNAQDATNIAPPFLSFNNGATADGLRELWDLHVAYFYRGLTLMAEWTDGYGTFRRSSDAPRTHLPTSGYYVAAGYFLTGETIERRTQVQPLHPFRLRGGDFGLGAVELATRFSAIEIGPEVFTAGLADPNLWTNRAYTIDLGANWYLNAYAKIVFNWEHAEFATPVQYRPGKLQLTSDLFWFRFQIFF